MAPSPLDVCTFVAPLPTTDCVLDSSRRTNESRKGLSRGRHLAAIPSHVPPSCCLNVPSSANVNGRRSYRLRRLRNTGSAFVGHDESEDKDAVRFLGDTEFFRGASLKRSFLAGRQISVHDAATPQQDDRDQHRIALACENGDVGDDFTPEVGSGPAATSSASGPSGSGSPTPGVGPVVPEDGSIIRLGTMFDAAVGSSNGVATSVATASPAVVPSASTSGAGAAPPGVGLVTGAGPRRRYGNEDVEPFDLVKKCRSLPDLWPLCAERFKSTIALEDPHREAPAQLNFIELERMIRQFAAGLQALGLLPGDKVALFADNSHRWLVSDQAILTAGGVDAVRGAGAPAEELVYIVQHSESVGLVVDNVALLYALVPLIPDPSVLRFVVVLWGPPVSEMAGLTCPVVTFTEVLTRGSHTGLQPVALARNDLATLLYTSGTTGKPKGVKLSHANLLHQLTYLGGVLQPVAGYKVLSLLPTWHIYERTGEYFFLSRGCTLVYTSLARFRRDLAHYQPQMFLAVPRVFEKFHQSITQKFATESPVKRRLIHSLLAASILYTRMRRILMSRVTRARPPGFLERLGAFLLCCLLWPIHLLGDLIVYRKVRQALGGRFKQGFSGGGSLALFLEDFWEAVGVDIIVGYGLSETSPVIAARRYCDNVRGSTGPPLTGTEILVVDPETMVPLPDGQTGLVIARGPQVMLGYHRDQEATDKVLSRDGWFNTGDLGWYTHRGHLVLTGRFKDTIVLSSGENIEPMPLEDAILQSPIIDQVMLVGQDEKMLGALIVPNLDALAARLAAAKTAGGGTGSSTRPGSRAGSSSRGPRPDLDAITDRLAELVPAHVTLSGTEVERWFSKEVDRLVSGRPNFRQDERVGPIRFVAEPFSEENGLLTQTLKIKRNLVGDRYADLIRDMYPR